MQAIYKNITFLIVLVQGSIAGLFLGQFIRLLQYQEPGYRGSYAVAGLLFFMAFIFFIRKRIQIYLLRQISFAWIYFFSLASGIILLLLLLLSFFHFEESAWIISAFQAGSLLAVLLLLADQQFLQQELLQKAYANLLQINIKPYVNQLLSLVGLLVFAFLYSGLAGSTAGSLSAMLQITFYMGTLLVLVFAGLKIALFRILKTQSPYLNETAPQAGEVGSPCSRDQTTSYYLEKNLEEVLLGTKTADWPLVCEKIRQIPLVDKIEQLERIREKHFSDDEELSGTLMYLGRLRNELPAGNRLNDIDRLNKVQLVKACIRTVIAEGNPMLVQKLLGDHRPEVKKSAILATAWFKETSFIPALVNLLKEHEYSFTAKEALREWGDQCIPFLRSAKYRNKENSFFITQCLELVEGYNSPEARDFLLEMLNEPQKQFQYKAALALLKNSYALSALHKTQILYFTEALIGTIAILREIRCQLQDSESLLYIALLEEEREKKTLVLNLLQAFLPESVWSVLMKTREEPVHLPATLCALTDLFLPLVLRNKCKILLAAGEHENIAPALQAEYLNEQLCYHYSGEQEAIRQVLKLDYSQIGHWLRLCALKHLAGIPGQQASLQMLGEIFNGNPLLQETAAEVLFTLNHDYYYLYMQRLPPDRAKVLKHKIESCMAADHERNEPDEPLLYDQILFLRSLPLFKGRSYEELARIIKFFSLQRVENSTNPLLEDPYSSAGYWIIYQGTFTVLQRGELMFEAGRGDVVDMSFLAEAEDNALSFRTSGEIKFLFVEKMTLNNLYLKSDYFKKIVIRPDIHHSARLQAVY